MFIQQRAPACLAVFLALSTFTLACESGPTIAAHEAQEPAPATSTTPPAAGAPAGDSFTGVVTETMNSGGYTYLKLKHGAEEIWAAALEFPAAVGERLTVPLESPMSDFSSRTLNRRFPLIYFVSRVARDGETLPASATGTGEAGMAASHDMSPGGAPAEGTTTRPVPPIDPPPGGFAIAEVWAKRQALGGTQVTVRGSVVKVNNGILGHNWLHLQDGSGSERDHTHDLAVTTDAAVKVGDVVTATGILTLDKDFGAGYTYEAILESATIVVAQPAH